MNIEKTLKKQSKLILSKNNWAKSITGFLFVLLVLGIAFVIIDISSFFMEDVINENNVINFSPSNIVNIVLCVIISISALIVTILLSPIYTGYIKFISGCRDNESGNIEDIFYYFSKGNYLDTIQLNIFLFIRKAIYLLLFSLPTVIMLTLSQQFEQYKIVFQICAVWLGIAGIVGYFLVSRLYIMTQYLYVSDFNYHKETDIIKASVNMVKKNYRKVISLYISYIFWWISCFFVIPIVFVYPYFKHTAILSYSYIYDIENNNPNSPYYKSNIKLEPEPFQTTSDTEINSSEPTQPLNDIISENL